MAFNQPPPQYAQAQGYPADPYKSGYDQHGGPPPAGYGAPPGYGAGQTNAGGTAVEREGLMSYAPPMPMPLPRATNFGDYPDGGGGGMDESGGLNMSSFSDKAVRRAFIRKVYLILMSQLTVTLVFIAVFIFVQPVKDWVQRDGLWFYIVAYVTFLVTYITLVCCPSVRRNYPGNFICLGVFTVAFSYLVGTISSFHNTNIVLLAVGITAAVCLSISLFAIQTKIDFTMCSGLLFALLMVLFFFGIACSITYSVWGYNHIMDSVYAGLGALVFALFLVYDTQMIVGGKKHELSPEEYISGALQLYIDVVYIFLFLLSLMGKSN